MIEKKSLFANEIEDDVFPIFPSGGSLANVTLVEQFTQVTAMRGLAASFAGVGSGFTNEDNDGSSRVGIGDLRTGTDVGGTSAVLTSPTILRFGGGVHRLRWDCFQTSLSDGTNTFTLRIGFIDSPSAEPTDGVYFRYTHSVNSGEWQAVTRAAGVETATDTNVAAILTWAFFEIEVNAAGTSAAFYINGVLVATNTTNIPTGANLTGIGVSAIKTAGAANIEFRVDLMAYAFQPS